MMSIDVNSETSAGKKRLRKVATICKDFGQRVQFSVFVRASGALAQSRVEQAQYEKLRAKLTKIMDPSLDSLRLYRLPAPREKNLECYGVDKYVDFEELLMYDRLRRPPMGAVFPGDPRLAGSLAGQGFMLMELGLSFGAKLAAVED